MRKNIINRIYLENFRGFSKKTEIKFAPRITLICGKGSVGKSTIIDAINYLAQSAKTDTDLDNKINTKDILSKHIKAKEFTLGFSATSYTNAFTIPEIKKIKKNDGLPKILKRKSPIKNSERAIIKRFVMDLHGNFYPKTIDLYSLSDDPKKFISLSNNKVEGLYLAEVSFIENQYAWKELHKYTGMFTDKLIENLLKCKEFTLKFWEMQAKISDEEKKPRPDTERIKKIKGEIDKHFSMEISPSFFNPIIFPWGSVKLIEKHKKFLERKKISLEEFVKYISDDIKESRNYVYKNSQLENKNDFRKKVESSLIYNPNTGKYERRNISKVLDSLKYKVTLSEFLIYNLSLFLMTHEQEEPYFPSKSVFEWSDKQPGKILSVTGMFHSCNELFKETLGKVKTVRHSEAIDKLINSINQAQVGRGISSDVHKLIAENQKEINKWLSKLNYGFKVAIERTGLGGATEIVHRKNKFKIPAAQGGSGAEYLLTFLTECLASKDGILLLEEPEKALHSKMQVQLAKFFVEASEHNQLIIETHSENLLLGLLKEVRDKNIEATDVKVIYVYMDDDNNESKIDDHKISEEGVFETKWRHGFFTERLDLI